MRRSRHRGRTDANQTAIVSALREIGCSVLPISEIGDGAPDLVAWRHVVGYALLEVKDGSKQPAERRLSDDEVAFHKAWRGPIFVVDSVDDAIRVMTGQRAHRGALEGATPPPRRASGTTTEEQQ